MAITSKATFYLCAILGGYMLSACISTQENPNYQYSTKYKGPNAGTMNADAMPADTMPMEATAVDFVEAYPIQPIAQPDVQIFAGEIGGEALAGAPTDLEFQFEDVTGTPGYMAFNGDAPLAEPVTGNAQPIDYDYSQNFVSTGADMAPSISDELRRLNPPAAESYTVRMGDTVYSLAKRYCVGVGDIQAANGLGADYAIQIGQTLALPATRC